MPVGGSSLMTGSPKAGKTVLVLAMIRALTEGGEFLGSRMEEPAKVWMFTEQAARSLASQIG